jgi:hypothetical protein
MANLVKVSKVTRIEDALDDLVHTVAQNAGVINAQGEKLKAYGSRLADVLTRLDALEARQRQQDGLETA